MGVKYGLVGYYNTDYDLLWIAQMALLNCVKEQPKKSVQQITKKLVFYGFDLVLVMILTCTLYTS